MTHQVWIIVTNLVLLPLWLGLWEPGDSKSFFNPYILWVHAVADRVIAFLRPVFRNLGARTITALTLSFLLVFRGLLMFNTLKRWDVSVAMTFTRVARNDQLVSCIGFSVLVFMWWIAQIWALHLAVDIWNRGRRENRAAQALRFAAAPIRHLPRCVQAAIVLAFHMLLIVGLDRLGDPAATSPATLQMGLDGPLLTWSDTPLRSLLRLGFLGVGAMLQFLLLARNIMLLAVLGSLVGAMTQRLNLLAGARDWIHMLLGRFAPETATYGGLNFAPLLFLIIAPLIYGIAVTLMQAALLATLG